MTCSWLGRMSRRSVSAVSLAVEIYGVSWIAKPAGAAGVGCSALAAFVRRRVADSMSLHVVNRPPQRYFSRTKGP
jgi:hypothetical protein